MGIFKHPRSKQWYFAIQKDGKRVQKSTGTTNKKLAQEIFTQIQYEIQRGTWFKNEKGRSTSFSEMWKHYKKKYATERDMSSIKHLLPVFGDKKLTEITAVEVEDFIIDRQESPKNPADATIYQEYSLGRRMFNIARKVWKWTTENPFSDISPKELLDLDNGRDRWLTKEEENLLLEKADSPEYLRDLIIFALHTGCRRGEILAVSWKNIDLFKRSVVVEISKRKKKLKQNGKKFKTIPMSNTLFEMLLRRSKVQHISGRLFPISASTVRQEFDEAIERSKLENFHFHDLRHTFATRLVQAGVNLYVVKELLGHESIKTTERYAHHCPDSLRPSVMVLDNAGELDDILDGSMKKASGEQE